VEGLKERVLVRARPVDRGNGDVQEPEIDRQLATMVVPVVQHDGTDDPDPGNDKQLLAIFGQFPGRHGGLVVQAAQDLFGAGNALLECG